MPCGHGFCSDCLRTEAKKVRQLYNEKWKELQQNEDKDVENYKISSSLQADSHTVTPGAQDLKLLP